MVIALNKNHIIINKTILVLFSNPKPCHVFFYSSGLFCNSSLKIEICQHSKQDSCLGLI